MHFDPNEFPGDSYFWTTLRVYWGTFSLMTKIVICAYPVLLAYVCAKGTKKEKLFYVFTFLALILFALNPKMAWYLVQNWNFELRYFRLFWIIPVCMGYTYFGVKLYDNLSSKGRTTMAIVVVALLAFSYKGVMAESCSSEIYTGEYENTGMMVVPNIYKVEYETIGISDIIERDSGDSTQVKKGLYDFDIFLELRVYDAAIIPVVNYARFSSYNYQECVDAQNWWGLMNIFFTGQTDSVPDGGVTEDLIKQTMENIDCEYVVLPKDNTYYEQWTSAFECIGESGRYVVLKTR